VYIGNKYGSGDGSECLNNALCDGTEAEFKDCHFTIDPHDDPSKDVSVCCYPGMILTVPVTALTGISTARLQSSMHQFNTCLKSVNINYFARKLPNFDLCRYHFSAAVNH